MVFSEKLREVRKKRGLSQKQLAEELGVYQKDISRWEKGLYSPSTDTFRSICVILNVSADEMLELDKVKPTQIG